MQGRLPRLSRRATKIALEALRSSPDPRPADPSRDRLLGVRAGGGLRCISDVCTMSPGFAGRLVDDNAKSKEKSRRCNPKGPALEANLTVGYVRITTLPWTLTVARVAGSERPC